MLSTGDNSLTDKRYPAPFMDAIRITDVWDYANKLEGIVRYGVEYNARGKDHEDAPGPTCVCLSDSCTDKLFARSTRFYEELLKVQPAKPVHFQATNSARGLRPMFSPSMICASHLRIMRAGAVYPDLAHHSSLLRPASSPPSPDQRARHL